MVEILIVFIGLFAIGAFLMGQDYEKVKQILREIEQNGNKNTNS